MAKEVWVALYFEPDYGWFETQSYPTDIEGIRINSWTTKKEAKEFLDKYYEKMYKNEEMDCREEVFLAKISSVIEYTPTKHITVESVEKRYK